MKRIKQLSVIVASGFLFLAQTAVGDMYSDRSLWEAAVGGFSDIDETQWGVGYTSFPAGTPVNLPSGNP